MTARERRIIQTFLRWQLARTSGQRDRLFRQLSYLTGTPQARGSWALGYPEIQQPWTVRGWSAGRNSYRAMQPV